MLAAVVPPVLRFALPISADDPFLLGLVTLLAGTITAIVASRRRGVGIAESYALRRVPAGLLLAVTVTVFGLSILLSEADNLLQTVLPPPDWFTEFFKQLTSGQKSVWGSLFALVIAAPLGEEPLFRGVILPGFNARYSARTAVIGSALFFGLAHLNPWQFVGAAVFGMVAGWWYLRTRSLVPCLWGHALGNGLPALLDSFGLHVRGYTEGTLGLIDFQPWWFDVVGMALLLTGLFLASRVFRRAGGEQVLRSDVV